MNKKQEITESQEEQVSLGSYIYNSMMNYFLTIFFIFGLMLFLLLLIILSREVLADASFERHLIETKSLLEELERVERGRENRFDLFETDISLYQKNSVFKRIEIDDLALISTPNSNTSFITLKMQNYNFELFDDLLLVSNIEPQTYDYISYSSNQRDFTSDSPYMKGLILQITYEEDSSVKEIIVLKDLSEFESNIQYLDLTHNDFFEVISKQQIRGIISLIY